MHIYDAVMTDTLRRLVNSGISLRVLGDQLQVKAPGGLDPALRRRIREQRSGLLELLVGGGQAEVRTEQWQFSLIGIPSQTKRRFTDIWILGERKDKAEITFWFVASQRQDQG